MSHIFRSKAPAVGPSYDGVPLTNMKSIHWTTQNVLNQTVEPSGNYGSMKSGKLQYRVSSAGLNVPTLSKAMSKKQAMMNVAGLVVFLSSCFVYPLFCIFYGLADPWEKNLTLVMDVCLCIFYFFEEAYEAEFSLKLYKTNWHRRSALQKAVHFIEVAAILPWGVFFMLVGITDLTLFSMGLMATYLRVLLVLTRYQPGVNWIVKKTLGQPPAQLQRLGWLFVTVLIIQNVFGGLYYYLRPRTKEYKYDYFRSMYYVYQTLLTIGYGDVPPTSPGQRLFAAFLCLVGVFVLATLVANMTSFLVNMDTTPAAHRSNVELIEAVMAQRKVSGDAREFVRKSLRRMWVRYKGFTHRRLLSDLPRSVTMKILEDHLQNVAKVPLFKYKTLPEKAFRPVIYYLLETCESWDFSPGEVILPPKEVYLSEPVLQILVQGSAQKVTSSTPPQRQRQNSLVEIMKNSLKHSSNNKMASASVAPVLEEHNQEEKTSILLPDIPLSKSERSSQEQPEREQTDSSQSPLPHPLVASMSRRWSSRKLLESLRSSSYSSLPQDVQDMLRDPELFEYHSRFKMLWSQGEWVGSSSFFGATDMHSAVYRSETSCQVMFMTRKDLLKLATLFPEWEMDAVAEAIRQGKDASDVDPRVQLMIQNELSAPVVTEEKPKKRDLRQVRQTRMENIKTMQRKETVAARAKRKTVFKMKPSGNGEVLWDSLMMGVILYNAFVIPIRLTGSSSAITEKSLLFACIDLVGDTFVVLNRFLKPRLLKAWEDDHKSSREGISILVNRQVLGERDRKQTNKINQDVIQKMIEAEQQENRRKKWKSRILKLRILMEFSFLVLSVFSLAFLIDSNLNHTPEQILHDQQTIIVLRVPFLLRTFMVLELFALLTHHRNVRARAAFKKGETKLQEIESRYLSSKLLILLVMTAHWISCYGTVIARRSIEVEVCEEDSQLNWYELSGFKQYMVGLYWALTTMTTVGYGDFTPNDELNSLYTSVIAVLGVGVYSLFVSLIGAYLKDTEISEFKVSHQQACLTAFLVHNEVSNDIQGRIWEYIEFLEMNDTLLLKRSLGLEKVERNTLRDCSRLHVRKQYQLVLEHAVEPTEANILQNGADPPMQTPSEIYSYMERESEFLGSKDRAMVIFDILSPALHSSRILQDVSPGFLRELCLHAYVRVVVDGEVIVSPTLQMSEMYILMKGDIQEHATEGNGVSIAHILQGACFNEGSLQLGKNQLETKQWFIVQTEFKAHATSEVWVLDRRAFSQACFLFPEDEKQIQKNYEKFYNVEDGTGRVAVNLRRGGKLAKLADMDVAGLKSNAIKARRVYDVDSPVQAYWNWFMFGVLLWNLVVFPIRATFALTVNARWVLTIVDSILDIAYIIDVFLRLRRFQFETASGHRISDPSIIWKYYLLSPFGICDLVASLPLDYLPRLFLLLSGDLSTSALIIKLRFNKLSRAVRFPYDVKQIGSGIKNQGRKSFVTICKLVFTLLIIAHWAGCLFHFIGKDKTSTPLRGCSALQVLGTDNTDSIPDSTQANENWAEDYLNSLYFGVTTMTGVGYGDIVPTGVNQVIYNIFMLIIGGLLYSTIIAFLEDIVAQADLTSILYQKKSDLLTQYVRIRRLPAQIRTRLKQYLLKQWVKQKGVEDRMILGFLSDSLRRDVMVALIGEAAWKKMPVLGESGLWKYLVPLFEIHTVPANALVFEAGQEASHLYLLLEGAVELVSQNRSVTYATLEPGSSIGQDAFFRQTSGYLSAAKSKEVARVAKLSMEDLQAFLDQNVHLRDVFETARHEFQNKVSFLDQTRKNLNNEKLNKMLQQNHSEAHDQKKKNWDEYVIFPNTDIHTALHLIQFVVGAFNSFVVPLMVGIYSTSASPSRNKAYVSASKVLVGFNVVADLVTWGFILLSATLVSRVYAGSVLRHVKDIRRVYFRSFRGVFDVLSSLPIDLVLYVASVLTSSSQAGDPSLLAHGVYVSYLARIPRLLWLVHFGEYWSVADTAADGSSKVNLRSGHRHLLKIVLMVLLSSHWLACCNLLFFADSYVDSLYLILYTMTTVGYGNLSIETLPHKVFAMFVMILGAFLCDAGITSTLVSIIDIEDSTRAMSNRFQEAALAYSESKNLGPLVKESITQFYRYRIEEQGLNPSEIYPAINDTFRSQIEGYVLYRNLGRSPEQCAQLTRFNPGMLQTLVFEMQHSILVPDDVLFTSGEIINKMVFVLRGEVKIFINAPPNALRTSINRSVSPDGKAPSTPTFERSFTTRSKEAKNAIDALENNASVHRTVVLDSPGLLLTNRQLGEMAKETIVCKTVCEVWVCDETLLARLEKLAPKIGGLFHSLNEFLADSTAAQYFSKFLASKDRDVLVQLVLAIQGYKKSHRNAQVRFKKAASIIDKFFKDEEKRTKLPIDQSLLDEILGSTSPDMSTSHFDRIYDAVLAELEKDIKAFEATRSFRNLVIENREKVRAKIEQLRNA